MLELLNIDKTYAGRAGRVAALRSVSLRVEPGDFLAVEGPSGCGKTTLLLVAGALLAPDTGFVRIDGSAPYDLRQEARSRLRASAVGFVFQQFHLIPYLSVLENVCAPTLALPPGDGPKRAEELLERLGLGPRSHHLPEELSTGERQRTALARALVNRPKLILADEPTGNLDRRNAEVVLDSLAVFAREGGAVLMVSHDAVAAARAHRRLQMDDGMLLPTKG